MVLLPRDSPFPVLPLLFAMLQRRVGVSVGLLGALMGALFFGGYGQGAVWGPLATQFEARNLSRHGVLFCLS